MEDIEKGDIECYYDRYIGDDYFYIRTCVKHKIMVPFKQKIVNDGTPALFYFVRL